MSKKLKVVDRILKANDAIAQDNRRQFAELGLVVLNLLGAPGGGKTSLIERTIERAPDWKMAVIEGDVATAKDAERIDAKGVPVVQINTGGACHLDAGMVRSALEELPLKDVRLLFIENVGNLVCPAGFDLGESDRVVVSSTTEGADKPSKYPLMFRDAAVVILNKIDLSEATDFNLQEFEVDLKAIRGDLVPLPVSCRTGAGLDQWMGWLQSRINRPSHA